MKETDRDAGDRQGEAGDGAATTAEPPHTALSQGPTTNFPELAARYLGEYEEKIRYAVARLEDDQLWWRANPRSNSIGNLLLHLAGNLTQWVVASIGGEPFVRHRDEEFAADRTAGAGELLARLGEAVRRAQTTLRALGAADLARPLQVQSYRTNVLGAAFHAVEHMSYHTGQILAVVKQLTGGDEPFDLYPQHRGE